MKDLSFYNTGVVWTGPLQAVRKKIDLESMIFNEPWMDNIEPMLLYRYWARKGYPGILQGWVAGCKVFHRKLGENIITWIEVPDFLHYTHNKPL